QKRERRTILRGTNLLDSLHDALAYSTSWHVDYAPQAHIVVGVDDEAHVSERVLDLPAFIKANAADDLVRDPLTHERVFNRSRLRVGPIQDGGHGIGIFRERVPRDLGDVVGFLELIAASKVDDSVPSLAIRPEMLVLSVPVPTDHGRGRVENDLGGSVVP